MTQMERISPKPCLIDLYRKDVFQDEWGQQEIETVYDNPQVLQCRYRPVRGSDIDATGKLVFTAEDIVELTMNVEFAKLIKADSILGNLRSKDGKVFYEDMSLFTDATKRYVFKPIQKKANIDIRGNIHDVTVTVMAELV